ncbi:hypothetical protein AAG906_031624 [Vitis piasezkii]
MSIVAETSRSSQHARLRRPRKQPTSAPDPTPQTHLIVHPTRKKSTISGLLGSPFSDTNDNAASLLSKKTNKKKTFTSVALSGLGCVKCLSPVVVGSSGEWGANKVRKKKKKKQRTRVENATAKTTTLNGAMSPRVVVVVPDLCCTPGIGLAASNAALVDFVEPTRSLPSRGRVNAHRTNNRERGRTRRRGSNHDQASGSHISNARRYDDFGHGSSGGLSRSEMMMLQSSLLFGENVEGSDRYGDWRLDVDHMSYEELLDLGDRIGYVGTGLREDEIFRCLRNMKHPILDSLPLLSSTGDNWRCSICQEEYEADDEVGRLDCGHCYHIHCIRQWLLRKNACAVCKAAAAAYN